MTMSPALDTSVPSPSARPAQEVPTRVASEGGFALFNHPVTPILTGLVVTVLVATAIAFMRSSGLMAGLWGAGGVAVAVWLRTGRGARHDLAFAGVMAGSILIGEVLAGNPPWLSFVFTVANMMEIVGAVLLARRFAPTLNLSSLTGAARFLIAAAVLAPIPAGLAMSGVLALARGDDFVAGFQTWWFGHALGLAVLGSLGLAVTPTTVRRLTRPWKALEAAALLAAIVLVYLMIYRGDLTFGFILLPLLMLTAVRLRVLGAAASLLIVAVLAVGSAMMGHGPYLKTGPVQDQVLAAQLLVLVGYMPMILLAALLEERDLFSERARQGQLRAESASAAKSRLLANVAHEIKSPIGGVIGIGGLWRAGQLGPVTPQQVEMAEMLVKTARQVEALAHDLLDVARAESGAVKVDCRPTDVRGLLEDIRRSAALRPEARAVSIDLLCEGDGLIALADSQRLAQVLDNLATNALKYGAGGGRIVLHAMRVDEDVCIEVTDFGPGLTLEKQEQLFEPFNRLGLERSSIEGHGVGLALAKRLVELQGGGIGVRSVLGEGSTFWVRLPKA